MNGKSLDAIFVCVGGGGLLAGVAAYVKALRPEVLVIGVEADDAAGEYEHEYNVSVTYGTYDCQYGTSRICGTVRINFGVLISALLDFII